MTPRHSVACLPRILGVQAPNRIFITGQGGSGKTTLARQLAECVGVPVYNFDNIAYQRHPSRKRSLDERLGDVQSILNQPAWIVDCWYLWWTEELIQAADAIIWLDLPWRVAAWRILTRHVRADLSGHNPHPGLRRLVDFLRSERRRYTDALGDPKAPDDDSAITRAATARALAPYWDKVVHCRRPAEVAVLLRAIRVHGVQPGNHSICGARERSVVFAGVDVQDTFAAGADGPP